MWDKLYEEAKESLNIAEHLYYVTFKHSKDANVLKAVIDRLVKSIEKLIAAVLDLKYEEGVIDGYSKNPRLQADQFIELFENKIQADFNVRSFIQFYLYLRKLNRLNYKPVNNYKRNVKIRFIFPDNEKLDLGPKDIQEYLLKVKEYFKQIEKIVFR